MKARHDLYMYACTAVACLVIGGLLINYLYDYTTLPVFMQSAIYLSLSAFIMIMAVLVALFYFNGRLRNNKMSERGYLYEYKVRHFKYAIAVSLIFVSIAAVIGGATEALYTFGNEYLQMDKTRAGSYIVADFSDSMNENDPQGLMKEAIAEYIREIDSTEMFGITLFSDGIIIPDKPSRMSNRDYEQALKAFNGYVFLESDANRENIISLVQHTNYSGLTNTNEALLTALWHIRNTENMAGYERLKNDRYYPAEIFLFSDGLPSTPLEYMGIRQMSTGGKIIPVSTVFYGDANSEGVEAMRLIAEITGGIFSFVEPSNLNNVFADVSSGFKFDTPKLLFATFGPLARDRIRIVFQWFLLFIWVFTCTAATYNIVGNKELFKEFFLMKLIWGGLLLIIAVGFINADNMAMHTVGRFLVAVSFAIAFPIRNREVRGDFE